MNVAEISSRIIKIIVLSRYLAYIVVRCLDVVVLVGYKYLEVVPGRRGGRPTIRGTRITVDDILEALSVGWNVDEIAENYEIPREAILEAIRYALESLKKVEVIAVETSS